MLLTVNKNIFIDSPSYKRTLIALVSDVPGFTGNESALVLNGKMFGLYAMEQDDDCERIEYWQYAAGDGEQIRIFNT